MEIFDETFTAGRTPTVLTCPLCGGGLQEVTGDADGRFLCAGCGHCWRRARRALRVVDPVSCPGCDQGDRGACLARYGSSFPRFVAALDA